MKTDIIIILIFMVTILVFTSVMLFNRHTWQNVEDFVPSWTDEKIFILIVYLFLLTVSLSWITTLLYTCSNFKRYSIGNMYVICLILFYFLIFAMSEEDFNPTELIVIASIILVTLALTILSRQILTVVPFLLYIYLFAIIYEIKNNVD